MKKRGSSIASPGATLRTNVVSSAIFAGDEMTVADKTWESKDDGRAALLFPGKLTWSRPLIGYVPTGIPLGCPVHLPTSNGS
jgi:hypothetical protein